ncbi:MAG: protein adenylyltransferase SelO [Bacteroidales bacterium]
MKSKNDSNAEGWNFDNSYSRLDARLFSRVMPEPVKAPELILWNNSLAQELGLNDFGVQPEQWAQYFSGNQAPPQATPLAQAYAGHQFGNLTMLGDGRAILLGEQITPKGQRFDIQLKGSGQTPYSRRGDGRATLYSMLREYLLSEAITKLGIPTTRSLAVTATGEKVEREITHRGALLTRVAASHIRVGTFEFLRYAEPHLLSAFTTYTIQRHFPELLQAANPALELLGHAIKLQATLVTHWMRTGFIHGVMNTDNMSIAGETIDYGPCAFMNSYHSGTVFSSIDHQGRYAFGNQPAIAQWNLGCLAIALLPLIHENEKQATEMARERIETFEPLFRELFLQMMFSKLGIANASKKDGVLLEELLGWMQSHNADYTNTFLAIEGYASGENLQDPDRVFSDELFVDWLRKWETRVSESPGGIPSALELMRKTNPAVIPRNHLVEEALHAAAHDGEMTLFRQLMLVLSDPYNRKVPHRRFQSPPPDGDKGYQTFCGT